MDIVENLNKILSGLQDLIKAGFSPLLISLTIIAISLAVIAFKWPNLLFGNAEKIEKQLGHQADRARLIAELTEPKPWRERYRLALERILAFADRFYGPNTLTFKDQWRGFDRCLLVAFVYPLILLLVGWLGGGSGVFGTADAGFKLLPDIPLWQRPLLGFALIAYSLFCFWFIHIGVPERFGKWSVAKLKKFRSQSPHWLAGLVEIVAGVGVGTGAIAAASAFAGAFAGAVAVAVAAAAAAAAAGAGVDIVITALVLLILFVFLPIINATFDYLSLQATRLLLRRAADSRHGFGGQIVDLMLDALIAVICLGGLAFGTGFLLEIASTLNAHFGGGEISWAANLASATVSTFSDGFLFIGMLMTTLVPTLIHLVLGLMAIGLSGSNKAQEIAALIKSKMSPGDKQRVASYLALQRIRTWGGVAMALAFSLFITTGLFRIGIKTEGPDGKTEPHPATNFLVRTALCGASFINGQSCPLLTTPKPEDIKSKPPGDIRA